MTSPLSFNTPDRIIRFAMDDAGLLQDGDDPSGEQYAKYLPRLNDLVNLWQTQGLKLWLNALQSITLVANQGVYTLGPGDSIITVKPMRVLAGYYVSNATPSIWRPLDTLSWSEYNKLSNPAQTGAVNAYFVDKQQNNLVVSFWLVPDSSAAQGTVSLLLQKQVTNLVSLNDTIAFPQEWFIALRWGLAAEICIGQPAAIVQRCDQKAEQYRMMLEDWDVEDDSITFSPDHSRSTGSSSFR